MGLQSIIAAVAGDTWISKKCIAIWPFPAIVIGFPETKLSGTDYRKIAEVIKPGDMLLERSDLYKITNRGIPERLTFLKHLAVYIGPMNGNIEKRNTRDIITQSLLGDKRDRCIIHAISEGVVCQDIFDLLKHADYCAIVRPWGNEHQRLRIIMSAMTLIGKNYDFKFSLDNNAYYCTEVGAYCLKAAGIELPETIRTNTSILGYLLPLNKFKNDVYIADNFCTKYSVIFESEELIKRKTKWRALTRFFSLLRFWK